MQALGKRVVADHDAALQSERADGAAVDVQQFRGSGWAVVLKIFHLRQVCGVDQREADERTEDG